MRHGLVIAAGIGFLIAAIGILIAVYIFLQQPPVEEVPPELTSDPFGTLSSATISSESGSSPLTLTDGSIVLIPDFSKTEQPPSANATNGYQVAGAADATFQILYFPEDNGFIITLNAEPLGETRRAAEAALRLRLGLSNAELCKMRADVGAPFSVSSMYAGTNLGLSFCPGSTQLP